jgi:hypothetical protein
MGKNLIVPKGDAAGVLPKAGVELAPNAGALCPNVGVLPNAGADAPNAGADAPNAGADAPNAGLEVDPNAGLEVDPKAGEDEAPKDELLNSELFAVPNAGADCAPNAGVVDPNGWLPKAGCDCPKDGEPNGFCAGVVEPKLPKGDAGF